MGVSGSFASLRGGDLIHVRHGRIAAIYHVENLLALTRQLSDPE